MSSGRGGSTIQSISPALSRSKAGRASSLNVQEIESTNPSGCAARDHSRNAGFRTSSMPSALGLGDHVRPRRRHGHEALVLDRDRRRDGERERKRELEGQVRVRAA